MLFLAVGMMSCSSSDDSGSGSGGSGSGGSGSGGSGSDDATSITVSTTRNNLFVNQGTTITVTDDLGNDVTSTSTLSVDGVEISTNPYTFTSAGDFVITAVNGDLSDATGKTVTAVIPTHTTKALVEDYTGTWCGYCPRLAYKLDQLASSNSNVIPAAIHSGDAMEPSFTTTMESAFSIGGYPSGRINRTIDWNETDSQVLGYLDDPKECGLALETSISGSTLSVTAKAHYDIDAFTDHKLVVYVLENGILADQANYMNSDSTSPWFGAGNPIPNFEHNHVVRAALTDCLGDAIPAGDSVLGSTYTKDFTFSIPGSYDSSKMEVVAFVVESSSKDVVNVQKVVAGSDVDFD